MTISEAFERLSFTHGFSDKDKAEAIRHSRVKVLEAGEWIFHEGDTCSFSAFVLSGTIRVYKQSETGREITLYYVEKGESCILTSSCILSSRTYPAEAVVESASTSLLVPSMVFRYWMKTYDEVRTYIFDLLTSRFAEMTTLIEEVAFGRMDQRIARLLLEKSRDPSPAIHVTHEGLAADLGTAREVVSRILKDFEHTGILRLSRGTITIIDRTMLNKRAKPAIEHSW
ncbi:MAG: Crp/Fnr family transcriptional regulator [Chlorobi bacterium]|nr:Crp/Fnr family transcriptional regulator [Chlorobiota bacterium]